MHFPFFFFFFSSSWSELLPAGVKWCGARRWRAANALRDQAVARQRPRAGEAVAYFSTVGVGSLRYLSRAHARVCKCVRIPIMKFNVLAHMSRG